MTQLVLEGEIAEKIEQIARSQQLTPEAFLQNVIRQYEAPSNQEETQAEKLERQHRIRMESLGMFDDDITDLSVTKKETLRKIFEEKYGQHPD